jgi:hypothetical protein
VRSGRELWQRARRVLLASRREERARRRCGATQKRRLDWRRAHEYARRASAARAPVRVTYQGGWLARRRPIAYALRAAGAEQQRRRLA